jgi:hypothetical protein
MTTPESLHCARCGAPCTDDIDPATGLCIDCYVGRDTCPRCGRPREGPWGPCSDGRCRRRDAPSREGNCS